ncbi:tubulin-specific chaperone C [Dendroctonus ponderosae]|uniref:C-CAP/cofactor C-like domain-containing protein n=1 Tax=Dendroctonus ponderosae TaxID=77166 RepID=U4UUB7_DENPD|nr:tubulin-specific chaperone C [Dendroctonus ponderosae]ERL93786.1 hypothetical protein D910_11072 [Dendroctonus ponderosae]
MELISEGADRISAMKNREVERQMNIQRKQESKKSISAANEQLDFFEKTFNEKISFIEAMLKKSQTLSKNELPEHFNIISKEILVVQKYVAASNLFLCNYYLQKCQSTLQALSIRAKELENNLLPKKKFGFKNKIKLKDEEKSQGVDLVDFSNKPQNGSLSSSKVHDNNIECGFYDSANKVLSLCPDQVAKKDVSLEKLSNCTVYLKGFPSTLHLNNLDNCRIFSGPVSTSIFAENCNNSTLVIACQQLRLHSSQNIEIYLHVTSRAIMEDCSKVAVAPYNWRYENIDQHFLDAGLDKQVNNWRCIDDFNWLNAERHSPNWREMEQEKRVIDWNQ